MHFVFQEPINGYFGKDADCFLHKCSWNRVLLRKQAGLDLAIAANAVVEIMATWQYEEDLSKLMEVTSVREGHSRDLLQHDWGDAVVLLQGRVNKLHLATYKMVKANQKHVFNLLNRLILVLTNLFTYRVKILWVKQTWSFMLRKWFDLLTVKNLCFSFFNLALFLLFWFDVI